jgi:hypothetical protein
MFKKSLIAMVIVAVGFLGMLVFCNNNNPAASTDERITGTWSAVTPLVKGGAGAPDTFTCVLTINGAAGTYSMQRGHVNYGSSGSQVDSTKETGTITKIGTDSLVLTPSGTSCYYYDPGLADWVLCDGTLSAQFRTCPEPMQIKIDITGNEWTVSLVRYDDFSSIEYVLKKQ